MAKELKITRRKIADYVPDTANANVGSERGLQMIEQGLNKVGAGRSIVVDHEGRIVAGNKTMEAAQLAGIEEMIEIETDGKALIVHKRTDWDLDDPTGAAREYAYLDNRASEVGLTWDANQIAQDVARGMDLSGMFTQPELEYIGLEFPSDALPDAGAQIDRADELLQVWQVKQGDLWVIPSKSGKGVHKLLCGDSTNADDVVLVMGGECADMVFTDPPYGIAFKGQVLSRTTLNGKTVNHYKNKTANVNQPEITNDELQGDELRVFCEQIAKCVKSVNPSAWYVCFSQLDLDFMLSAMRDYGLQWRSVIAWMKNQAGFSGKDYKLRYEPIIYGQSGGAFYGERYNDEDVWQITRTLNNDLHPTMKPIELVVKAINNSSQNNNVIFDPFLGSGTTLVACEQTGRLGRGLEIEPKYVSVILQRMKDLGLEPILSEDGNIPSVSKNGNGRKHP